MKSEALTYGVFIRDKTAAAPRSTYDRYFVIILIEEIALARTPNSKLLGMPLCPALPHAVLQRLRPRA